MLAKWGTVFCDADSVAVPPGGGLHSSGDKRLIRFNKASCPEYPPNPLPNPRTRLKAVALTKRPWTQNTLASLIPGASSSGGGATGATAGGALGGPSSSKMGGSRDSLLESSSSGRLQKQREGGAGAYSKSYTLV